MRTSSMIDEWLLRNRDASQRPSSRIGSILDEIHAGNRVARSYTVILDGPARQRSLLLDRACGVQANVHALQRPLLGVPVAIKDNIDIMGTPTSCGSVVFNQPSARSDAAIVRQLEFAGAIVLGKTNMDEAALGASGRNEHFGRCYNPTDAQMLSGGSSSGSAAAVAAGHALLAIGTDTLGSVRIPAALCGVSGFKPSHGRIDNRGVAPLYPGYDTVGCIAPGLEDLIYSARVLGLASIGDDSRNGIRAIWVLGDSHLADVDPVIAAEYRHRLLALHACAWIRLLELPPFDFAGVARAALWEVASSFASRIGFSRTGFDAQRDLLGVELRQILLRAATLAGDKLEAGRRLLRTARTHLLQYVSEADAIFTPTCPIAAVPAAAALPRTIAQFVAMANVAGLPAVCWPQSGSDIKHMSWQLIGKPGEDQQLLRLAAEISTLG